MAYKIEELNIKDDSEGEQKRTRVIFDKLKEKTQCGEEMTEHEKDFFCQGVMMSKLDDGKIEDYNCCSNFRFKVKYLDYIQDLFGFGLGSYLRFNGSVIYSPDKKEIYKDITYLISVAKNWESIINTYNHSEELLQQIAKETRDDLRILEDKKGRLYFRGQRVQYSNDRRATLLRSKYIYCTSRIIFEMFDRKEFILNLNEEEIEINEYSIIHILNRHFSQITKPDSLKKSKSFHIEDFAPKYLNKQLKVIFDAIENSGLYKGVSINKIAFKAAGIDYMIWVNKRTKQIAGQGNVEYNRLETFYPITEEAELQELNDNYELKTVNENIGVFIKK